MRKFFHLYILTYEERGRLYSSDHPMFVTLDTYDIVSHAISENEIDPII